MHIKLIQHVILIDVLVVCSTTPTNPVEPPLLLEDRSKRLNTPPNNATAIQLTRVSVAVANNGIVISK